MQYSSVVDRHQFHCVVDIDPDQHQNDADPHPTSTRFKSRNLGIFFANQTLRIPPLSGCFKTKFSLIHLPTPTVVFRLFSTHKMYVPYLNVFCPRGEPRDGIVVLNFLPLVTLRGYRPLRILRHENIFINIVLVLV